ncbi:MAG: phosphate/phosphite/phosphonate ABC transporter substrate-binding protein [Alphaproteobacteria bacterium]
MSAPSDSWAADREEITTPERTTLTIGRVSGNPRKHAGRLAAFGGYLAQRLAAYGPTGTNVVLDANPQSLIAKAGRGEIDVISETVFTASRLVNTGAMEIALLEWKRNIQRYRTALIVRVDSDIHSLADLRGRTLAFEDAGSTSGFFLPYLEIMDAGLDLAPVEQSSPAPGAVRYAFAKSEVNVVGSVIRGRADVGAISETDLDDPEVMTARFKPQLRVFHLTQWVPRSVLLLRRSMDPALKSKLMEVLLEMHEDEAGKVVLDRYFEVGRYAVVDAESRNRLEHIRKAVQSRHGG